MMQKKKNRRAALERAHIAIPPQSRQEFGQLLAEDREMPTKKSVQKRDAAFIKEAHIAGHLLSQLKKITGAKIKKLKQGKQ